jgi:beta-lactamase class A
MSIRRSTPRRLRTPRLWLAIAATWAALLLATMTGPAAAQQEHRAVLQQKFQNELARIAAEVPGVMGISVVDLTDGARYGVNEALVFPQGSSIKVPILVELYRQADAGQLKLAERMPIRVKAGGSGILQHFGDGTAELSLRDLAVLMIVLSDNTATNLLIERVGMERVNRTMGELGLANTRLQRIMIRPEDSAAGRENISTPAEATALMVRIARCELPLRAESCRDLRSILEIPKSNPGTLPSSVRMAWKGGSIEGVRAGWGIVELPGRPFAVGVMVNYADGPTASAAIAQVVDAAYGHFGRLAGATPHGARVPLRYLQD